MKDRRKRLRRVRQGFSGLLLSPDEDGVVRICEGDVSSEMSGMIRNNRTIIEIPHRVIPFVFEPAGTHSLAVVVGMCLAAELVKQGR